MIIKGQIPPSCDINIKCVDNGNAFLPQYVKTPVYSKRPLWYGTLAQLARTVQRARAQLARTAQVYHTIRVA